MFAIDVFLLGLLEVCLHNMCIGKKSICTPYNGISNVPPQERSTICLDSTSTSQWELDDVVLTACWYSNSKTWETQQSDDSSIWWSLDYDIRLIMESSLEIVFSLRYYCMYRSIGRSLQWLFWGLKACGTHIYANKISSYALLLGKRIPPHREGCKVGLTDGSGMSLNHYRSWCSFAIGFSKLPVGNEFWLIEMLLVYGDFTRSYGGNVRIKEQESISVESSDTIVFGTNWQQRSFYCLQSCLVCTDWVMLYQLLDCPFSRSPCVLINSREQISACRVGSGIRYLQHLSTNLIAVSRLMRCPTDTNIGFVVVSKLRTA